MTPPEHLLRAYARLVLALGGARALSLYLPASRGSGPGLLLHEGPAPPAPELADEKAAAALDRQHRAQPDAEALPTAVPGRDPECRLVRVPLRDAFDRRRRPDPAGDRREHSGAVRHPAAWIGLRFADEPALAEASGPVTSPLSASETADGWPRLLSLAANLAAHACNVAGVLHDRVTGLPLRAEFHSALADALAAAGVAGGAPASLALINPDDFLAVNVRFGREAGDRVLRELAQRLRASVRGTDRVFRYGGAIFACLLNGTPQAHAGLAAKKILRALSEGAYLDGAVRLGFSIGAAAADPADGPLPDSLELTRRADRALHAAKRAGGSQVRSWKDDLETEESGHLDRLTGIFTGNMAKDYRNMTLLWDSVHAVAASSDHEDLARRMVERLRSTLNPERVAIAVRADDGAWEVLEELGGPAKDETAAAGLDEHRRALLEQACNEDRAVLEKRPDGEDDADGRLRLAVPLRSGGGPMGAMYLEGGAAVLRLDATDLVFLEAFASQLTVAFDRARIAEQERLSREQEQLRLREELEDLRRAVHSSKLSYCSAKMGAVLATARRVAPTDATVLIAGESGVGKELMARTVHALSSRRDKPLVVVDCGAISASLIESELFGHEKGAFTGAVSRKTGRLVDAEGATVFLDEIGELPLEVQSKLLRFVQEKQVTPVGSTRTVTVDARILAATNVDLAARVAEGRFREDLFHRLNVVCLTVPPLRERPDDVLHLAEQFVRKYAALYQKEIRGLDREARELLVASAWPGNVRELQNRIMQAVLLGDGPLLTPSDFRGLGEQADGAASAASAGGADRVGGEAPVVSGPVHFPAPLSTEADRPAGDTSTASDAAAAGLPERSAELLERLRSALDREVEAVTAGDSRALVPLGKWLADDLVLAADEAAEGVARRAASLLGVPETTFRRRVQKARGARAAGLARRTAGWEAVREPLERLVRCDDRPAGNLIKRVERLLLERVTGRFPGDVKTGSALLGVTEPTLLRRLA